MNDQGEQSQSPQPDQITEAPSTRRRLRFGQIEEYPDSPITIPPDRREKARELLVDTNELWTQGKHLEALTSWYANPVDIRSDAVGSVLLDEAKPGRSLSGAQYETEGHPENFVLQHYALIANPAVGKIFQPDADEPITEEDWIKIKSNPGDKSEFRRAISRLGISRESYDFFDYADFKEAHGEIISTFTIEEARDFFLKLIPNLSDEVKKQMLSSWGIVNAVKWADLLTDSRLGDDLERPILGEISWASHLEQFLASDFLPSVDFFEEAFKRLGNSDKDPNGEYAIQVVEPGDTTIPSSLLYYSMLRRVIPSDFGDGKVSEARGDRIQRITTYLLSDEFMYHVLPYLQLDKLYADDFIAPKMMNLTHNATIDSAGDEAKFVKRKRFGQVIQAAIDHASESGDEETAQKLRDREIGGIKFGDLLQAE